MKKIIAALLLVLFVCGCTETELENSDTSSAEQITLRLFTYNNEDALNLVAEAYGKENPNVTVTVTEADGDDDFALVAKALLSGENYPSLILTPAEFLPDLEDNFADLSGENWVNNAVANSISEVSREGKVIAMPAQLEGIGFVYNKEIFGAVGINPENINSLDRLAETVEYLAQKIANNELKEKFPNLTAVFDFPNDETTFKYLLNTILSQECATSLELDLETVELKFADSLKTLIALQTEYARENYNDPADNMINQRVAVTLQSHKFADLVAEKDETFAKNLGLLPVSVEGASQDSIILNVPDYLAVNKNATKEEINESKKFLSWLYSSDTGRKLTAEKLSYLAPFDNFEQLPANPLAESVRKFAISGKTMPYILNSVTSETVNSLKESLSISLN